MCMNVLLIFTYVYSVSTRCPQRPEEGIGCPGTRVTLQVTVSHHMGAGNQSPEEQQVFLPAVPSLQHLE